MVEPKIDSNQYRTIDTPLATYLFQEGFTLLRIEYEKSPNKFRPQAIFVFANDDPKMQECIKLYNSGEATVNLILYEHAKSSLLDRIMRGLP